MIEELLKLVGKQVSILLSGPETRWWGPYTLERISYDTDEGEVIPAVVLTGRSTYVLNIDHIILVTEAN